MDIDPHDMIDLIGFKSCHIIITVCLTRVLKHVVRTKPALKKCLKLFESDSETVFYHPDIYVARIGGSFSSRNEISPNGEFNHFFSIDNVISTANMARLGESLKQQASPLLAVNIELQPANMGQFYSAKSGKLSQKVMS